MATAEEYGAWIVANKDKQGTPEFETVANAYKLARGQSIKAPEKEADVSETGIKVGAAEGALAMASGMIAKPISDVMGLAATAKEMISPTEGGGNPEGFKRAIQDALTYAPRTKTGELVAEYNPLALLAKGVNAVAGGARNVVAPEKTSGPIRAAIGQGLEETINQAPGFVGAKAASAAPGASAAIRGVARDTMQSALKPTWEALRTDKAGRAIDTMFDEGINVSPGGVDTLQGRIGNLNNQIATVIQNSPAVIDRAAVGSRMTQLLDRFQRQVDPLSDVAAIQGVWDNFMNHPLLTGNAIPVQLAQELKQGTYRALGDKSYGELKGASIEAQKTLARGLKEEIATAVPEVQPLNARESALLNVLNISERRVLMEANKNPIGFGWLTTDPVKFAGWMADRSGLFKSIVARMLNTTAEALPGPLQAAPVVGAATGAEAAAEESATRDKRQQRKLSAERRQ